MFIQILYFDVYLNISHNKLAVFSPMSFQPVTLMATLMFREFILSKFLLCTCSHLVSLKSTQNVDDLLIKLHNIVYKSFVKGLSPMVVKQCLLSFLKQVRRVNKPTEVGVNKSTLLLSQRLSQDNPRHCLIVLFSGPNPDSSVVCVFISFIIIWIGCARSTRKQQQHLILQNLESIPNHHYLSKQQFRNKTLYILLPSCKFLLSGVLTLVWKIALLLFIALNHQTYNIVLYKYKGHRS